MFGDVADVTAAKKKQKKRANVEDNPDVQALRTLERLLRTAMTTTHLLNVGDELSKQELLDSLMVAEISVLRLLGDEGVS